MFFKIIHTTLLLLISFQLASTESLHLEFPSVDDASEFASLSNAIYDLDSCDDDVLPDNIVCYWYDEKSDGTQYMILISGESEYIAVVYAGTYSIDDIMVDMDIDLVQYDGPNPNNDKILVHEGFNDVLFSNGVWNELFPIVYTLHQTYPDYRLITSGHSLGGAEAIMTATALAYTLPDSNVISISYGTPKIGDESWVSFANSISNLAIWRFVNGEDIIPRHPKYDYMHVGHTIQLNERCVKAYYLHYGDESLDYSGIPSDWDATFPTYTSLQKHKSGSYAEYVNQKSSMEPKRYYVSKFSEMRGYFDNIFWWKQQSYDEC